MPSTHLDQTGPSETGPARHGDALAQVPHAPVEDDDRIASDLHDILINQIFIVSLDLHAARTLTDDAQARARITRAIRGLDHAITDLRQTVLDLAQHTSPPGHEDIASVSGSGM
ncbi:histidine kinase dimerization/phosphoacceptor domain-containing protein [Sphaerisporangium dianthi]|uniref:Histidine kinase dimerization/phosphoacceptor domain-containing protein n=1 Tax=Sphaerisporangium dianthi TaxID=1436120 RepID=A0ABV9CPT3_9ACTN